MKVHANFPNKILMYYSKISLARNAFSSITIPRRLYWITKHFLVACFAKISNKFAKESYQHYVFKRVLNLDFQFINSAFVV